MKASLLHKLDNLAERYEEVGHLLSDVQIITDQEKFRGLSREYAELEPVIKVYQRFVRVRNDVEAAHAMRADSDPDIRELAEQEISSGEDSLSALENSLQLLLLPTDPNDNSNVFLEIRAGTGGDEAAIFSGDLFRMYSRYAESQGWKVEIISLPEAILMMSCAKAAPRRFRARRLRKRIRSAGKRGPIGKQERFYFP